MLYSLLFLSVSAPLFTLLGGRGEVLREALGYSGVLFSGAIAVWLFNTLASILRGTGDMRVPSAALVGSAVLQITLGGLLGLGFGPVPRLGMPGVALGQILAQTPAQPFCTGTCAAAAAGCGCASAACRSGASCSATS